MSTTNAIVEHDSARHLPASGVVNAMPSSGRDDNHGAADYEAAGAADRAFALLHQFASDVVDRGDMVRIDVAMSSPSSAEIEWRPSQWRALAPPSRRGRLGSAQLAEVSCSGFVRSSCSLNSAAFNSAAFVVELIVTGQRSAVVPVERRCWRLAPERCRPAPAVDDLLPSIGHRVHTP